MTAFEEMGVLPEIAKAVEEMEWTLPTDVQAEAIPLILGGGDVLMAAETGSGKTGAFCLPVLQIVWETMKDFQSGKDQKVAPNLKPSEFKTCCLNLFDRGDAMAITPDGFLCQSRDQQKWHGARCTRGVNGKGKYYFEATITDEGLCRVGWSTLQASLDLGTDDQGFGYGGTGKKSNQKQFDDYGEKFGLQDTIGCYLDLDSKEIFFSKNGKRFETAFQIPQKLFNSTFYPAVVLKNAEISFNFGQDSFKFPPENGFMAVSKAPEENSSSSGVQGSSQLATPAKNLKTNAPMCVIIEPSRELAEQTYKQIEMFKKYLDAPKIRNLCVVGGVPAKDQIATLNAGIDIVTGTTGRLEELINNRNLILDNVRFFILDEADGLLSAKGGSAGLIRKIHSMIPKVTPEGKRLQMVVCSATLHNFEVKKLADQLMHFPQWIDLKGQDSVPETVHHVVCMIDPKIDKRWINMKVPITTDGIHAHDEFRPGSNSAETLSEAVKILKGDYVVKALREHKMDQCLIFCRTKLDCDNLENYLNKIGKGEFACVCLHGDRSPKERQANLQLFKDFEASIMICTDVAARGLDIHGLPYVINVTLPDEKANYLHRIGRVGRAERMGLAISLVSTVPEKVWWHECPSKGKNCNNTRLTKEGGCAIWYNEPNLLAEIEDHLGVTIQQVQADIKVAADEYDGNVIYGAKRDEIGAHTYQGHANMLISAVKELSELEKCVQTSYLHLRTKQFMN